MGQFVIAGFLFFGQRMKLRPLGRKLAVFMQMIEAQITRIGQTADLFRQVASAIFEQRKIMVAAWVKSRGDDYLRLLVHHHLRLLGMPLLLSAVVPALLFWGRSMGCSVTSTNTTSINVSLGCKAFLPSNRNSPDFMSTFSTLRIVRHTVASLTP